MIVNIDIWLSHSMWTPVHAHFPHTYIHTCRHTHAHTNNKQEGSNEVKVIGSYCRNLDTEQKNKRIDTECTPERNAHEECLNYNL